MYRKNVCCFIFNDDLKFLGCVRIDNGQYQCVQGGIETEDMDNVLEAGLREIKEEIGLLPHDVHFVQEIQPPNGDPTVFRYKTKALKNKYKNCIGQEQRILLFYAHESVIKKTVVIPPKELKIRREFRRVLWVSMDELCEKCPPIKTHIFKMVNELAIPIAKDYLKISASHPPPTLAKV
ncbi:unnamed protein product [Phytomonas sp. Hart1]|nr:unnamed protein product [Phytomonas sp. Hart1]|eukprot:CCW69027.1 unnamed protein product [Phytomonas sp. isolate Hart1]